MEILTTTFASTDTHRMTLSAPIAYKAMTYDVRLAPFRSIKAEFEKVIQTGYLRQVTDVRLMYHLCGDSQAAESGRYLLKPVWVMGGFTAEEAASPSQDATVIIDAITCKIVSA